MLSSYAELSTIRDRSINAPTQLESYKEELRMLNSRIGAVSLQGLGEKDTLLQLLADKCEEAKVVLKQYPTPILQEDKDGFQLRTYPVTLQGTFQHLLMFLHSLEKDQFPGKISAATFKTYVDKRLERKTLVLTLYIQQIIIKDEKS